MEGEACGRPGPPIVAGRPRSRARGSPSLSRPGGPGPARRGCTVMPGSPRLIVRNRAPAPHSASRAPGARGARGISGLLAAGLRGPSRGPPRRAWFRPLSSGRRWPPRARDSPTPARGRPPDGPGPRALPQVALEQHFLALPSVGLNFETPAEAADVLSL